MKKILSFLFLILSVNSSFAVFRHLTIKDGLYNNQARQIIELPNGQILVATDGMFNLYNGVTFVPQECNSKKVYQMPTFGGYYEYVDTKGLFWIKDQYKLYLYNPTTRQFQYNIKEILGQSGVRQPLKNFYIDNKKNAWLLSKEGKLYLFKWNKKADFAFAISPKDFNRGISITNIISCKKDDYIIFFNDGLIKYWNNRERRFTGEDKIFYEESVIETHYVYSLRWNKNTLLFAIYGKHSGLYRYDINTRKWEQLVNGTINGIYRTPSGDVAASSVEGFYTLDHNLGNIHLTSKLPIDGEKEISNSLMEMLYDRQGGFWICTFNNGVLYQSPSAKKASLFKNDIGNVPAQYIRTLTMENKNTVIVGTASGIYKFDTNRHVFSTLVNADKLLCFNSEKDSKGNIWVSTSSGLYRIAGNSIKRFDNSNIKGITENRFRFCTELSNGCYLVCNMLNKLGLLYLDKMKFICLNNRFPQLNNYRTMVCSYNDVKKGRVSICTQNGCFYYDYKNSRIIENNVVKEMETFTNKYNCQFIDSRGKLWMGTQNGLLVITSQNHIKRITTAEGLPNNCIQSVIEDLHHNIWVSTSYGIARIATNNGSNEFSITSFDRFDGIQDDELFERSAVIGPDGTTYFGGIGGITSFSPNIFELKQKALNTILVGIKLFDKPLAIPANIIKFNYDQNFITLDFSALNYMNPQHTHYRYWLKGVDDKWNFCNNPNGNGTAHYTSLSPGKYRFVVQAAIADGKWGKPLEYTIIITPPFWRTWWAYLFYVISFIVILAFFINFYLSFKRAKMNIEIEARKRKDEKELDEMKFRFFTNISHEFRTPLTLIITPLEALCKRVKESNERNELIRIHNSAIDLLKLVNQLLDFRRLEQKGETLNAQPVIIRTLLEEIYNSFIELSKEKNIALIFDSSIGASESFILDSDKMRKMVNNLLSNAFKFTPSGGKITIESELSDKGLTVNVIDNGVGIPQSDLNNIFTRFYQSNNSISKIYQNTSSGIGLHVVKGYAELHNGSVNVKSEVGSGSCFSLFIPSGLTQTINTESYGNTTIEEIPLTEETDSPILSEKNDITLLIVEDNQQFREFLSRELSSKYKIITASDGVEGLDIARTTSPNMIISDVMMPRMDGYQLCRLIKNDIKYSHIPIILLTAKSGDDSRASGYESGADSYISKPFNMDMLLARIHQLLEQQEKRKQTFSKEINIDPKAITVTSLDEQLIQKALDCIEKNMDNGDYSVDMLSGDLGINRTNLYRKLQSIIGQTPSEFMRSVRLKRAAKLLEESQLPINQISWMVGFNTVRYFSSYFKEMFGVTPSEYSQMKQEKNKQ